MAVAALLVRARYGDDAVMLVLAADHLIRDEEAFARAVARAREGLGPSLVGLLEALGRAVEDVGEDVLTRPADVDRLLERTLGDGSAELDERAAG